MTRPNFTSGVWQCIDGLRHIRTGPEAAWRGPIRPREVVAGGRRLTQALCSQKRAAALVSATHPRLSYRAEGPALSSRAQPW